MKVPPYTHHCATQCAQEYNCKRRGKKKVCPQEKVGSTSRQRWPCASVAIWVRTGDKPVHRGVHDRSDRGFDSRMERNAEEGAMTGSDARGLSKSVHSRCGSGRILDGSTFHAGSYSILSLFAVCHFALFMNLGVGSWAASGDGIPGWICSVKSCRDEVGRRDEWTVEFIPCILVTQSRIR